MKLNQLALAAVALIGASQAFAAAPTQYMTGASASSTNVMKAARNLCANAGGTFNLYKVSTATNSLGNVFTGVCSTGLTGATSYTSVAMNVAGGSASAVTGMSATTQFLLPAGDCTAATGTEILDPATTAFGAYNLYICPSASGAGKVPDAAHSDNQLSDGGFMDVEGTVFPSTVLDPSTYNASDFKLAGFSQAFGVGVNSALYNALQTAQGLSSTCQTDTTVKYTAACQPSLNRAQVASLINSSKTNYAKTAGGKFLLDPSATLGSTDATQVVYCERPQTSGTQQSAQLYFLNYGGAGSVLGGAELIINGGAAYPATPTATSKYVALVNSGSADVKACLNQNTNALGTSGTTSYRFGMLSFENNPLPALGGTGTDTYRFVKLSGVAGAQGVSNADSNTATALTGDYDYVFETVAYCQNGTCPAVLTAIQSNLTVALPKGASTAGLFLGKGVETRFSRGSGSTPSAASPYLIRY